MQHSRLQQLPEKLNMKLWQHLTLRQRGAKSKIKISIHAFLSTGWLSMVEMSCYVSRCQDKLQVLVCAAGMSECAHDGDLPGVHSQYMHAVSKHRDEDTSAFQV